MNALALVLAVVIGLTLGLLGGGGSILTVPTFVYVLGFAPKQAIALSLPVVGATSLFGAIGHGRAGNVNTRIALIFGGVSFVGSFISARLSRFISGEVQLALLGAIMLAAAALMYRGASRAMPATGSTASGGAEAGDPAHVPGHPMWKIGLVALGVGLLTGLVGIGGGFVFVPALVLFARLPMKVAVGTSTLVIAINTVGAFLGYHATTEVPWRFLGLFTLIAVGGILSGAYLVRFIAPAMLRRAFAIFLLVVGSFMLVERGWKLARARQADTAGLSHTAPG
ncbi:MAG: sulfite exporter TauE/SafE family protein [Gemmatimonadaceae bacterium]